MKIEGMMEKDTKKIDAGATSLSRSNSISNRGSRRGSFSDARSSGGASTGSFGTQSQLIKVVKTTGLKLNSRDRIKNKSKIKNQYPLVTYDHHDPDLKAFYWNISNKTKVDQVRFKEEFKKHFKDQADALWPFIRRIFGHFKHPVTFHDYIFHLTKFLSFDIETCKEIFFIHCDLNKDKQICETDLFRVIKSLKSHETNQMIINDLMLVMKTISKERKK
jgi:hypothetical protein